jgi:NAD(P)-dependent dehydrogenase (short-subunit alcohol dehydrogenase family)
MNAEAPFARHHAIITGGGSGIGAAIAEGLARLGAAVSLMGRNQEKLRATADHLADECGARATTAAANVTDAVAVQRAIDSFRDRFGAPTILINNAGIGLSSPFVKADESFWRKLLDANLMGAVYCTQAVLPLMLKSNWGRIVNVASTAGLTGYPYITAYCAAKHALVGLTRALAIEIARTGVTVNAVCPSYVDTDMTARTIENIVQKTGRSGEEAVASLIARNPQGRLIQPSEVADAVVWLCGEKAGAVTGQTIVIAGGELM